MTTPLPQSLVEKLTLLGGQLPAYQPFGHLPTPLERMDRLFPQNEGPSVYIKRDDCTGLAFGGNKTRKLEFLIADAFSQNADTVMTVGAIQSNHVRQTMAAANKFGLKAESILVDMVNRDDEDYRHSGNRFLDDLLNATVHACAMKDAGDTIRNRLDELRNAGHSPYFIPGGGSNAVGSLGYLVAAFELAEQAAARNKKIDHIIHASSSCGTCAGLTAGFALMDQKPTIHAVHVSADDQEGMANTVTTLARETLDLLELNSPPPITPPTVHTGYFGTTYGQPTNAMKEAVSAAAQREGLLLDPVYSGKAFAALMDFTKNGTFQKEDTVVFLHTGGAPALFAYESEFHSL